MKDLDLSTSIQSFVSGVTKLISSIKYTRIHAISRKLFLFRAPSIRLALAVMLVFLTLTASMIEGERSTAAFSETIGTFAGNDCSTAKSAWGLNETACAVVTGTIGERRIVWVAPDGSIADVSAPFTGNGSDTYTFLPTGPLAQYGTWIVKTVDNSGGGFAIASFLVRDASMDNVDLVVSKFGPDKVIAGGAVSYRIEVLNRGPNVAQAVVLSESTPNDTTFASEALVSGPNGIVCGNPNSGETGTSTCTIPSLGVNESAIFSFVYNVNAGTPVRTLIVNTATVSSSTNELFQNDNTGRFQVEVAPGTASPACTITCPADINVDNNPSDPNPCVKNVSYTVPTATSGCADPDSGQIPTVVCSPPSGSNFPVGSSSVVCSAGSSTCTFTITINETRAPVAPTIACPSDVTANESSPGAGSARVNYPAPTTTGNCVSVVCNPQSGDLFSLGTTPVTCTGTDSANTIVTCSFSVTVNVSTCGINCPVDITVNESTPGSGSATVSYETPTTTGCSSVTIVCNPTSGSSFPVGITQVNCTAADESSSILATCSFTVRVNSSSTCTITCPANVTASESPTGSGSAIVTYPTPTSTGTCEAAPASCNPPSGSTFPVGTTTVQCTRSDPAGNVSSCSFTVTVTGGTPCTITCPSNISQASGGCVAAVTYPSPTTTGSCGDPANPNPWSCNPPSGSIFPVGTTTVVCSTDVGTSCSFTITIQGTDATPPVIVSCAPPTFALADSTCQAPVPNVTSGVEASDNCTPAGFLTVTQNPAPGTIVGTGTTTIIVTVKDANNNSVNCSTTFTLFEATPPTALCKPFTAVLNASGIVSITAANVDNGSSDNCAIASRTVTPNTFICANKGANTVTLTVTDASGNSSQCTAIVTVVDNTPPTINCPANITLEPTCPSGAIATYTTPVGTDNCPGATTARTTGPASGSLFPVGTTTVIYTVTDAAGLTASCSFTVTVLTPQAVIQNMINQVQLLRNQGKLSGQQSQGLTSKLAAALDAVNENKTNVACNKLGDFINQVTSFINNGTLTAADGQPLINSAAHVRNYLGCTNLGCS